jgi:hypothetical protein
MPTLHVQDTGLATNDRVTVTKLQKLGFTQADTPYQIDAAALGTAGLSTNGLVALARAVLPLLKDTNGNELRPKGAVARQVTVYDTGAADFTLALDLVA